MMKCCSWDGWLDEWNTYACMHVSVYMLYNILIVITVTTCHTE